MFIYYLWRASVFRLKLETTKYIDELGKIAIQFSSTSFWKAPLSGCDRFGKVRDEWNNDHQKMSNDINQSESLWIQLHILRECFCFWLVWFWRLGKFSGWVFNFNHPYISINGNSRNADWWSSPAKTVWFIANKISHGEGRMLLRSWFFTWPANAFSANGKPTWEIIDGRCFSRPWWRLYFLDDLTNKDCDLEVINSCWLSWLMAKFNMIYDYSGSYSSIHWGSILYVFFVRWESW